MGQVLSEDERKLVEQSIAQSHVSEVGGVSISGALKHSGEAVIILSFTSCCGITHYEMPIANVADMMIGLQGAQDALKDIGNGATSH